MSRFTINMPAAVKAVVGFDTRLEEFFLDVYRNGEMVYTGLSEVTDKDSLWLAKRLAANGIVLPPKVYTNMTYDAMGVLKAVNASNMAEECDCTPTPLEAQLSRMQALQLIQDSISGFGDIPSIWWLRPEDDDQADSLEYCLFVTDKLTVAIPAMCTQQYAASVDTEIRLTESELLTLLQTTEEKWDAYKSSLKPQS